ncbi:hypothetical protein H0H87_007829 [Tephrocybe sp. NHM501043]|nr:hypothetical protein H0H87_007829 [Tephrocybe sp. NHM501043]
MASRRRPLPLVRDDASRRTTKPTTKPTRPFSPFHKDHDLFPLPIVLNSSSCISQAIKDFEEKIQSDLSNLRVTCSQALLGEQLKAERLRTQSLRYLHERNFAWAKMKALMAEKTPFNQTSIRRSKSLGAMSLVRNYSTIRQVRSVSPVLPSPASLLASASSSPDLFTEIKKEEQPISLSSTQSASPVSPTETLVADDPWTLLYPDPSNPPPKVPFFLQVNPSKGVTLDNDHMDVIYKKLHNSILVCRMCILKRNKLPKDKQSAFHVASYHTDTLNLDLHLHCVDEHFNESIDIARLPRSTLQEMAKGFAKTDRDEDFEIDYTCF